LKETTVRAGARRIRRARPLSQWLVSRAARFRPLLLDFDRYFGIFLWFGLALGFALIGTIISLRGGSHDHLEEIAVRDLDDLRPALDPPDNSRIPMPARYVVEDGDTLLAIAYRFGSSVDAIRLSSGLPDEDRLSIGQVLVVPPARSMIQQVDPEAPLAELAESFSLDSALVAAYNGRSADRPAEAIGQTVVVIPPQPVGQAAAQSSGAGGARPAPGAAQQPGFASSSEPVVYTVGEGDTILSIADKLGVDPAKLAAANRIADRDWIIAGAELSVPLWTRPAVAGTSTDESGTVFAASVGASSSSEAAAQRTPITYEVLPGDTVSTLAARFGVDSDTIVTVNQLSSADQISIGEQLTILPVSGVMYNVQNGDSLSRIASLFEVDLGPIIDFNYLEDADRITVGAELIIPGGRPLPQRALAPSTPPVYIVTPGDTIDAVARRFGVSTADIVAANGLRSPDRLSIGQSLTIEAGAAARGNVAIASTQSQGRSSQQTVTRNLPVPAAASAPARAVAPSVSGGSVASIAMQFRGRPYVWGGTTPAGFDCSGFVYYVLNQSGSPIPRGMWGQYNAGSHPSRADLQPGDIVFFQNTYMAGLSHNGIYIGGGQFIHASDPSTGVTVSSLSSSYWASRWFGATRVR
jgi:cell wall-associated NlpC family hydrolase